MRRLALLSLVLAMPFAAPQSALAQSTVDGPDMTVTGENRIVCRRVTRTATRMRTGRLCRTQAEWARAPQERNTTRVDAGESIDGAADSLELLGEKVSTGCGVGTGGAAGPY